MSLHALSSPVEDLQCPPASAWGRCQQPTPLLKAPRGSCPILGSEMLFLALRLRDLRLPLSTTFLSILSHRAKNNLHSARVWAARSSPCPRLCPVPVGRVGEGAGSLAGAAGRGSSPDLGRLQCECWGGGEMGAGGCVGGCIWDSILPWALGSGLDRRSHPASSAGNECVAAGRGCQVAGWRAGVGGMR